MWGSGGMVGGEKLPGHMGPSHQRLYNYGYSESSGAALFYMGTKTQKRAGHKLILQKSPIQLGRGQRLLVLNREITKINVLKLGRQGTLNRAYGDGVEWWVAVWVGGVGESVRAI